MNFKKQGTFFLLAVIFIFSLSAKKKEEPVIEQTRYLVRSESPVYAVAWSHDGKKYASAWGNSILVWSAEKDTIIAIFSNLMDTSVNPLHSVKNIEFSFDDKNILCVTDDNSLIIHNLEGKSDSILIPGVGEEITDACFLGEIMRFAASLDGHSIYECLKLEMSDEFVFNKKLDLETKIVSLTSDRSGQFLLAAAEEITYLIDTEKWEIIEKIPAYTQSKIKPKMSSERLRFIYAKEKDHLAVINTEDARFNMDLKQEQFSYVAEISNNENWAVVASDNGRLHLFDLRTLKQERMFDLLVEGDQVISLAWSSNDEFMVFGTRLGYLYRIDQFGNTFRRDSSGDDVFSSDRFGSSGGTSGKKSGSSKGAPKLASRQSGNVQFDIPDNFTTIAFDFNTLNSDYFFGNLGVSAIYRYFKLYPIHFAYGFNLEAAIPGKGFDYKYNTRDGTKISNPFVYCMGIFGSVGMSYPFSGKNGVIIVDISAGPNFKRLFNNDVINTYASKTYLGGFLDLMTGIRYKQLYTGAGMGFDSNYRMQLKLRVGFAM